jgi:hypothetical protein
MEQEKAILGECKNCSSTNLKEEKLNYIFYAILFVLAQGKWLGICFFIFLVDYCYRTLQCKDCDSYDTTPKHIIRFGILPALAALIYYSIKSELE